MLVRSRMYPCLLFLLCLFSIGRSWDVEGKNVLEYLLESFSEKKEFEQGVLREREAASTRWPVREGSFAEGTSSTSLQGGSISRTAHRKESVARRLPYYHSREDDHDTKPPVKSPHYTWPPSVRVHVVLPPQRHGGGVVSSKPVVKRNSHLHASYSLRTMEVCGLFRVRTR